MNVEDIKIKNHSINIEILAKLIILKEVTKLSKSMENKIDNDKLNDSKAKIKKQKCNEINQQVVLEKQFKLKLVTEPNNEPFQMSNVFELLGLTKIILMSKQ